MNQLIKIDYLAGFEAKSRLFGQHGKGVNLSIDMLSDPIHKTMYFILNDHGTERYKGPDLKDAVSIYNAILFSIESF
jgi:hypothetical protein